MPVGSHKDAFKAHQLVKKISANQTNAVLANLAQEILLDFVKNARQVNAERNLEDLPPDSNQYDSARSEEALAAVEKLCGKCDESHDDHCFVNLARRVLIKIRTGADLGAHFDGKKSLDDLLKEAFAVAQAQIAATPAAEVTLPAEFEGGSANPQTMTGLGEQVTALEHRHRELVEKDLFRATLIDEIRATIATVAEGNFAAAMPVHDDEQLGKLATAFNLMLDTVNQTMRHLDGLVAERSANLSRIMDTVPVGLLSLDEQLRVNPEYAKSCETILGVEQLRGRHFAELLGLTNSRQDERHKLEEFLDLFCQRILPEEDMAPLNPVQEWQLPGRELQEESAIPSELDRRQRQRLPGGSWIRTNFHLIDRGPNQPPHLLVTVEDISRAKAMATAIVQADRENAQLKAIAEDPDLFCEFLGETLRIVTQVTEHLATLDRVADPQPLVNEMFRGVHTIKGTAAALGLDAISRQAASLENEFSRLRDAVTVAPAVVDAAREALAELHAATEDVVSGTAKLLGHCVGESDDTLLRISARNLGALMEMIRTITIPNGERETILAELAAFRLVPARKGLARALRIVPGLLERLGKEVSFVVEGEDGMIDIDTARELNTPLVHLFRNALDHGIESPEEREKVGKAAEGTLRLAIGQSERTIELRIADDGRGLDPALLRAKAVSRSLLSAAEAESLDDREALNLIFRPGFSTAEAVSDVSGRGVGMDAVLTSVRDQLGGTVTIESSLGQGTTFIITIPAKFPQDLV